MSSAALATVRKLRAVSGDGGWLWQQNLASSIDAPDGLLVGRPIVTSEYLGALGSSPTGFTILCGDFAQAYELVRIGPMVMLRDELTVKGKISLYFAQRLGGRLVDNDAVKVLKA